MKILGTLRHVSIEGGVWLLVADDGRKFQLQPAPVGHANGARVEVEGDADAGAVSFQMAGPILKVRNVRKTA